MHAAHQETKPKLKFCAEGLLGYDEETSDVLARYFFLPGPEQGGVWRNTRAKAQQRESEWAARNRGSGVGRERSKGRESDEISNPCCGHNRALRLASRCACIFLQLSSFVRALCARLITSVLRNRRKMFESCICTFSSRLCQSTCNRYATIHSMLESVFKNAATCIQCKHEHTQRHPQLQELRALFVLTFPPISESPKLSVKEISGGKPPVNANSASSKVPCSDTRRFTSA